MTDRIDETLKKIAAGMQTGKTRAPADAEGRPAPGPAYRGSDLPGDPNCPYCGGMGYLRRDLPVGHPDFGKLETCSPDTQSISKRQAYATKRY